MERDLAASYLELCLNKISRYVLCIKKWFVVSNKFIQIINYELINKKKKDL